MKTLQKLLIVLALCGLGAPGQNSAPARAPDIQKQFEQFVQKIELRKAQLDRAKLKGQAAQDAAAIDVAHKEITDTRGQIAQELRADLSLLVAWLYRPVMERGLLSAIEQKQLNKQVGASGGTPGSTSVASRGLAPELIGFAVENGALQQTVTGTILTVRGNPAGILTALAKKNLVSVADTFRPNSELRFLKRFSFSGTFDISRGTEKDIFLANRDQLTGFSARLDLYNHRAPKDPKWDNEWEAVRDSKLAVEAANQLASLLESDNQFKAWLESARNAVEASTVTSLHQLLEQHLNTLRDMLSNVPAIMDQVRIVGALMESYASGRNQLIDRVTKSAIVTLEYNNTRQVVQANQTAQKPPDLSNLKLVYTRKFPGNSELTANLSTTLFDYRPKVNGARTGVVRDAQGAMQFDIPLPEIQSLGKGTLTFAGLVLRLFEEPLGQKVQVNGKEVAAKGTVGVAQVKLTFPVTTGVRIPIAVSYATRTELLPNNSEVRGNIGLTLDIDKLFTK